MAAGVSCFDPSRPGRHWPVWLWLDDYSNRFVLASVAGAVPPSAHRAGPRSLQQWCAAAKHQQQHDRQNIEYSYHQAPSSSCIV